MATLTKLSIKTFRNVVPTTLEFRPGINIVLGKNAAGKTTLLRLLSLLTGAREEALQDEVLEVNFRASGDSLDFSQTITKTRIEEPVLVRETELPLRESASHLQRIDSFVFEKDEAAVLQAEVRPTEAVLNLNGESHRISINASQWPAPANAVLSALSSALKGTAGPEDTNDLFGEIFSSVFNSSGRLDESLEYWKKLLDMEVIKEGRLIRSARKFWGRPSSFTRALHFLRLSENSTTFSLNFLDRAADILGYDSAMARFDVEHLTARTEQPEVRLSNLRFFFKKPGEEISHSLLSYGQKRLLSFFAYADASKDVIIADELVNGLHHEWISACLNEIGGRQAFLTSQNPLLLDFLRFDSAEDVRRAFILCERISNESGSELIWRNPSEEEADSFFAAYQTGIQRVSDILFTKGLW
jgi:energy-coupling factor transporter ATP-binding protein EcfA2